MARLRKKHSDEAAEAPQETTATREHGPWDSSEKPAADDDGYVDLGSLRVRGEEGFALQLPADNEEGDIGSVMVVAGDAALELRAFAATRSGGLWEQVRADIAEEVSRIGGECSEEDGPYGVELRLMIPATTDDGEEGVQPSRIIGVEGPRWMLRATLLGSAALQPQGHPLTSVLQDVVVVRGAEPRIQREPLLLTVPADAVAAPAED